MAFRFFGNTNNKLPLFVNCHKCLKKTDVCECQLVIDINGFIGVGKSYAIRHEILEQRGTEITHISYLPERFTDLATMKRVYDRINFTQADSYLAQMWITFDRILEFCVGTLFFRRDREPIIVENIFALKTFRQLGHCIFPDENHSALINDGNRQVERIIDSFLLWLGVGFRYLPVALGSKDHDNARKNWRRLEYLNRKTDKTEEKKRNYDGPMLKAWTEENYVNLNQEFADKLKECLDAFYKEQGLQDLVKYAYGTKEDRENIYDVITGFIESVTDPIWLPGQHKRPVYDKVKLHVKTFREFFSPLLSLHMDTLLMIFRDHFQPDKALWQFFRLFTIVKQIVTVLNKLIERNPPVTCYMRNLLERNASAAAVDNTQGETWFYDKWETYCDEFVEVLRRNVPNDEI